MFKSIQIPLKLWHSVLFLTTIVEKVSVSFILLCMNILMQLKPLQQNPGKGH
jgi:hypothetical protein